MTLWTWLRWLHTNERGFLLPAAIGLLAGQLFGGGGGGGGSRTPELTAEQRELLDIQRRRLQQSNPLYEAILRLAMQLMPGGGMSAPPSGGPGEGGAPGSPLLAPEGREPFLPEGALSERFTDGGARAGASVGRSGLLTRNLGAAISRLFPGALQRMSQRASLDASQQAASRAAISALARRASFGPALTADLASGAGWGNLPGGVGELAQIRAGSAERGSRIDELMREMDAATLDVPGGPSGPELFA